MLKFICNKCKKTKKLQKATIKVIEGKVRTAEAKCKCGKYMQEYDKEFGVPYLIRTEPTLKKN